MPRVTITRYESGAKISAEEAELTLPEAAAKERQVQAQFGQEFGMYDFSRRRKGQRSIAEFLAGAVRVVVELDHRQPAGASA